METVSDHPCRTFQQAMKALVAGLKNPQSYQLRMNGCRAVLVCGSKQAWLAARGPVRRYDVLRARSYASHGKFGIAVGVA